MRYCPKCGCPLEDNAILCPSCGSDVDASKQVSKPIKSNRGMAIAGFCCSFFVPVFGYIFGGIGLSLAKTNPEPTGKGFSIWAIIVSTLGVILSILVRL